MDDERIFRFLKGRATPEEAAELTAWRRASPDNEAYFVRLAGMLEAAQHLYAAQERPAPPPIEELTGEQKPAQGTVISLPVRPRGFQPTPKRPRLQWAALVGGAAVAVAILLLLVVVRQQQLVTRGLTLAAAEYITDVTESAMVTLGDGSVVRLAPDSRLRVVPSADRREVWLDGRAFFAVSQDEDFPFIVQTASGRTRVLGTRFDVEARNRELQVIVVEGRVELETSAGKVELAPNQLSLVREGEAPRKTEVADVQGLLEWLDAFIVFQSTPLTEVAQELEARFGIEIRIASPALARQTVTGWSNSRTAQDILTRVCLAVNARCELSDSLVVLEERTP